MHLQITVTRNTPTTSHFLRAYSSIYKDTNKSQGLRPKDPSQVCSKDLSQGARRPGLRNGAMFSGRTMMSRFSSWPAASSRSASHRYYQKAPCSRTGKLATYIIGAFGTQQIPGVYFGVHAWSDPSTRCRTAKARAVVCFVLLGMQCLPASSAAACQQSSSPRWPACAEHDSWEALGSARSSTGVYSQAHFSYR